jgi:hypothetical protein
MAHPSETQTSKDVNGGTALGNGIFSAEPRHQDQELSTGDEHEMMLVRAEAAGPKLNRIPSSHAVLILGFVWYRNSE